VTRLLVVGLLLLAAWAASTAVAPQAHGCAFAHTPTTYEVSQDRGAYLAALDLAGYNMLFPTDTFFGTGRMETGARDNRRIADQPYLPPTLLKAIGWIESGLTQARGPVPWSAVGPALISFDCGHGIMQITSGMTSPADHGWPSQQQALVATDYLYNIGRGAAILADKWNGAPGYRPIAGTDTDSDPTIIENWYFAVWGYNGFTGPGANRSNHPMDPGYGAWPRTGFSCGPLNDGFGHSYSNYPYQEIVFGCAARPPSVAGAQVWTPLPVSLPDLNDPLWSGPLDLSHWSACASTSFDCAAMDIPSPRPTHHDDTSQPAQGTAAYLLGSPVLSTNRQVVSDQTSEVVISNTGSGILPWRAKPGQSWITIDKQGGVALSPDVACSSDTSCDRSPTLTITATNAQASSGWVDIESLITGGVVRITVATRRYDVNCDGATNPLDALLLLQYIAGVTATLPCPDLADANGDGTVNVLDSLLILQFDAGLYVPTPEPTPTLEPEPTEPTPTATAPTTFPTAPPETPQATPPTTQATPPTTHQTTPPPTP
jgi:hypothetical protein